jgi:hypothetical protein
MSTSVSTRSSEKKLIESVELTTFGEQLEPHGLREPLCTRGRVGTRWGGGCDMWEKRRAAEMRSNGLKRSIDLQRAWCRWTAQDLVDKG